MKAKTFKFLFLSAFILLNTFESSGGRPNVLLLTADDLGWDSLGCMGNSLPGLSPNLDRLASEGILIRHAYVASPICGPSRQAIYTGQFPQRSGFMGHGIQPPNWWRKKERKIIRESITSHLKAHGYLTGLIGKHGSEWCRFSVPPRGRNVETGMGRNPQKYIDFTRAFINQAKREKKPFFLSANTHDPHRYWANHQEENSQWIQAMMGNDSWRSFANGKPYPDPGIRFAPKNCPIPFSYHRDKKVKTLLSAYYGSVNRMDEIMGGILRVLQESGQSKNTIVLFLSDHGMAWDLSKWSLYPSGVRSPLIIRWPARIKPGIVLNQAVVSVVDLAPSIADFCEVPPMNGVDGRSFKCLLIGSLEKWRRTQAFSCFNYMNNEATIDQSIRSFSLDLADKFDQYRPSRALNNPHFSYVWNGWSNEVNQLPSTMLGEYHGILSKVIENTKNQKNQKFLERKLFIEFRCPEELYNLKQDPSCQDNLANDPNYSDMLNESRGLMKTILSTTKDHELENFLNFISNR